VLVSAERWAPAVEDPFPAHQPPVIDCPPDASRIEPQGLELDTGRCGYFLLTQPSLADLRPGDRVEVALLHQRLTAPDSTHAHVAIAIGDDVLWEREIPIPGDAQLFQDLVEIDHPAPAGTPIVLHLHNHGFNTYTLLALRRGERNPT
jgi:hypothetical protein